MRCYIAGPMRSRPQFNYPAFFAAQAELERAGWQVFNPARMDIENDDGGPRLDLTFAEQKAHSGGAATSRRYAARDLKVILWRLRAEDGDAVVMLDGWEDSTGATAERAVAKWVGLTILTLEEAIRGR